MKKWKHGDQLERRVMTGRVGGSEKESGLGCFKGGGSRTCC